VALKLHNWPGPPEIPRTGVTPDYVLELPNFHSYYLFWPDTKGFADGAYKIGEAQIGYGMTRTAPFTLIGGLTPENQRLYKDFWNPEYDEVLRNGFCFGLGAISPRELKYQEKVLDKILEETGGSKLPLAESDLVQSVINRFMYMMDLTQRTCYHVGFIGAFLGGFDTWDLSTRNKERAAETKAEYIEKGALVDASAEDAWGQIYEGGHFGHLEELAWYDPADEKSVTGSLQIFLKQHGLDAMQAAAIPLMGGYELISAIHSPCTQVNYHRWHRKIKKNLDPNWTFCHENYAVPEGEWE
jgi:hypothetical protein